MTVVPRAYDILGQIKTLIEADTTIKGQFAGSRVRAYYGTLPKTGSVPAIVLDVLTMAGNRRSRGRHASMDFKVDIWAKGGDAAHTKLMLIADAVHSLLNAYDTTWTGSPSGISMILDSVLLESMSPISEPTDSKLYGMRLVFSALVG